MLVAFSCGDLQPATLNMQTFKMGNEWVGQLVIQYSIILHVCCVVASNMVCNQGRTFMFKHEGV